MYMLCEVPVAVLFLWSHAFSVTVYEYACKAECVVQYNMQAMNP